MSKMQSAPRVSVLLLNWNGIDFTKQCLRSLILTQYPNLEIIVVDNGSENNEAQDLKKEFGKKIKIIRNKKNVGYGIGMNIGYKYARGKYVAFINNDMEFSPSWLEPLVRVLERNNNIGACQPKLINMRNKHYFDYASAMGGFVDILGYPFARGRIFTHIEKDNGQYQKIVKISWNGIFIARKELLEKTGLFNPIYFNYGEDMDLSFRIYGLGYIIVSVPQSIVYHYNAEALKKDMIRKMFYHHRNNLVLILINWPFHYLLFVIPARFLLDLVAIFYYLGIKFNAGAIGVVKGYISLLSILPYVLRERNKTQKLIKKGNFLHMPIYKGSIVFQYFILGKKTFGEVITNKSIHSVPIVN